MRKRFKIPLFGIVAIAILIITGLVLLYQSHILENWANRYLADQLADRYGLDVTIGEIEGSFVTGFRLTDVLVKYITKTDTTQLAYLPRVEIDYKVGNLWNRRWIVDSLRIDGARLYLKRDSLGRWLLPAIKGRGGAKAPPPFAVQQIDIENASLEIDIPDNEMKWYEIQMAGMVKSEEGMYSIRIDKLRFNSDDGRVRVNTADGMAAITNQAIALQGITIVTDSSYIAFSLIHDKSEEPWTEVKIDSSHVHLPDVVTFLGSQLKGDLDMNGTIYRQYGKVGGDLDISGIFEGRDFDSLSALFHYDNGVLFFDSLSGTILNGCTIDGFGDLSVTSSPPGYNLVARVDSFDLNQLIKETFTTDLNGHLVLNGRGLKSNTMAIDLDVDLDESYFDIYHMHHAVGQMTISNQGMYFFPGFQVAYHDNRFLFDGNIDFKNDIDITCHAMFTNLADFTHQTFIDLPAGRGEATFTFTGPTNDFDVSGHFMSDSLWLYELYSHDFVADFNITSFLYGKRGWVNTCSYRGDAWSFPYDSLAAYMTLDSNLLYIDSSFIANSLSHTTARGMLDYETFPQELTFSDVRMELSGQEFVSSGEQVIYVDSSGFVFSRVYIDASDGRLMFWGRADYDESINIDWDIEKMSIAPWAALINDSLGLDGKLSSTGHAFGTLTDPDFTLELGIDSLGYKSLLLGDLTSYLSYYDSLLYIDSSFLKSPEGLYTASGTFPIILSMGNGGEIFDEREQNISITARDKRLDLAAFVMESVEYMTGDFAAEITLTGKPLEPHVDGTSSLRNGIIKPIELRNRLEQVHIELEMADQLITVKQASAVAPHKKSGTPGTITAGGTLFINSINEFTYDLQVECKEMPVNYELGEFDGIADATMSIEGMTPPKASGAITMHSAFYRENFEEDESGFSLLTALEADKMWDLDLLVDCPSNCWVKNDDIDAEFSGQINIIRNAGIYNFLGTLEVIRGKYYFFDKTFKLEPGGQIIYNNIDKPDPQLDLQMSTRIRAQNPYATLESDENYSFELQLAVTGTLNNPIISGTGDTPISSEDIIPIYITGYQAPGSDTLSGSPGTESEITSRLGDILANQFTRLGTRSLGVETFEINPAWEKGFNPSATRLTIGAYTLPNLYVFGSSYFDVERGQEVGVEYRLGRHYLFEGRRDEDNLYHFNFKLSWEY